MIRPPRSAVLLSFLGVVLAGCASDAAHEPEADALTPGAFVAVDNGGEALTLVRTLTTWDPGMGETLVFITEYDVVPRSWDEAREIAKRHTIPIRAASTFAVTSYFAEHAHRVVWFRTLTEEEQERAP